MIDGLMRALAENMPEIHERFAQLRARDERAFIGALTRAAPIIRECSMMSQNRAVFAKVVQEEFQLEDRLRDLGRRYQQARSSEDQAAVSEMEGEIERLVRRQVELGYERRRLRLDEFQARISEQQARLDEQRKRLAEETAGLDDVIRQRINRIKQGPSAPGRPREGFVPDERPGSMGPGRERGRRPRDERSRTQDGSSETGKEKKGQTEPGKPGEEEPPSR